MTKLAAGQEGQRLDHKILVYVLCGRKRERQSQEADAARVPLFLHPPHSPLLSLTQGRL